MRPYGRENKTKGSGKWKKDYHVHIGNRKIGNWGEDFSNIISRKKMKQKPLTLICERLFSACVIS